MKALRRVVAVFACATAGMLLLAPPALSAGKWTATGSMNSARIGHTETLLPGGKVLVAGGCCALNGVFASAELYDPASGTWSTTGSMTTVRTNHTATLLDTGQVLAAAGEDAVAGNPLASAELYDPAAGTWTATGSLNTARVFHTATLLENGRVLIAGGFSPSVFALASAESYHPKTGVWVAVGSMNTGRNSHTAALLPNGQVLVAGGVSGSINNELRLASAELFTPPTALELAPSLVTDSTGLGPGKALAKKATAIQTAVNAGQTARACGRIAGYLALVKAHTGKKLTPDEAIRLTTEATDLADELGC